MAKAEPKSSFETTNVVESGELTPEVLVHKYASAVLGFCLAHTGNVHDSEDIMQEVFINAFKKFDSLRDRNSARGWLLKIARRKCIDHYRNSTPTQKMPTDVEARSESLSDNVRRLHKAISRLPDGYREPITLYYLDGQKCANVAKCLGISEEAVRSRLVRARLRLHEILLENKS